MIKEIGEREVTLFCTTTAGIINETTIKCIVKLVLDDDLLTNTINKVVLQNAEDEQRLELTVCRKTPLVKNVRLADNNDNGVCSEILTLFDKMRVGSIESKEQFGKLNFADFARTGEDELTGDIVLRNLENTDTVFEAIKEISLEYWKNIKE